MLYWKTQIVLHAWKWFNEDKGIILIMFVVQIFCHVPLHVIHTSASININWTLTHCHLLGVAYQHVWKHPQMFLIIDPASPKVKKLKLRFINLPKKLATLCQLHNWTPIRCLCMWIMICHQWWLPCTQLPEQVPIHTPQTWVERGNQVESFCPVMQTRLPGQDSNLQLFDQGPIF